MENITFARLKNPLVRKSTVAMWILVFGLTSSLGFASIHTPFLDGHVHSINLSSTVAEDATSSWNPLSIGLLSEDCDGDGVTCAQEEKDGTDPNDPCDFILAHQDCTPSEEWKKADCDGDGVTNSKEKEDGTDPLDSCDLIVAHQNCTIPDSWKNADCDGDGVTNGKEKEDGTDPLDPCDFVLEHQDCTPSDKWKKDDCDGDGVTNGKEKEDGTDPLDSCDFILEHQDCSPSEEWKKDDCDGDGVTNGKEKEDGTDPLDPCDFILAHQDCTPSEEWKKEDCDGDGVTNGDEKEDGTDPLDPCDYDPDHVTLPQSGDYLEADCDGDGVTNEDEIEDGTDPNDSCDFVLSSQTVEPSSSWNAEDCDGDGVTNEDEKNDGTDPLDPCDYNPDSITLTPSADWELLDCDDDGNPNGTDPNPLTATAVDDSGSTPALTEVAINILENDDYLPNNDENNLGITNLSRIGGSAAGIVSFDAETGLMTYTPTLAESNSTVTVVYEVCNVVPDPAVCASATVTIEVGSNTIVAVDDSYTADGSVGGVIADSNVLDNDTLNGDPVAAEDVVLSSIPTDELTINADGSVSVTPGTPEGTYTIDYSICEAANPTNCDTATVTVEVGPGTGNIIDAVDDSYTADGSTGGVIADSNVLDNDNLNGDPVAAEDVVLTSTPTVELTINADGSVSVTPGTPEGTYTIDYSICEAANPTNCDTATVTVEVGPGIGNIIDAVDDSYTADGSVGGVIADSNVLDNDTLNGDPVAAEDVVLSSTPTVELTINADGSVSVTPGTPEGTYTIDYSICEAANPTNCDTATVTVEVGPGMGNIIDAVDDSYTADGSTGGVIADSNVLDNDTLNGDPVAAEDVVLSSTPTVELTINADGSVSVAPGTPEGTYTIDYTICEVANPTNCDTATVTVEVGPGTGNMIDAVDDSYTADGSTGGVIADSNVLDNDTLNGEPVTLEDVLLSSTTTDELTVNDDGTVSVTPGTPEGTYTIDYTICDIADVDNCDTATVTVEVGPGMGNIIDAVDDSYTADGSTGGVIADSNVLDNDTLNGEPVTLEDVLLSSTATDELTVNDDGTVSVTPGTPEGTYSIDYTICDIANVDNCDTATVTVEVESGMDNVIDAMDDGYDSDSSGGLIQGSNVLDNDTLNGELVDAIDVILTSTPTGQLTINDDGSVTVAPGLEDGTYTIEYTICEAANPSNCDTATVTVNVESISVNQLVTPNGDLKNDFLFIRGTDKIRSSTLKIFNRWGTAVYEGRDYNNINNVFDGRSRSKSAVGNNNYLPAGVYFYIFEYVTDKGSFMNSEYIYISR